MKRRTLSTSLLVIGSSFFAGSIVAAEFSDQAQVTSVRAVFGSAPQTRCWVDREQIREERRGDVNVPGAVVVRSSVACSGTRGVAVADETSRRLAAPWPARWSAAT